jgi:hypothetical protein
MVDETNQEVTTREKIANTQFSDAAAQQTYYQTQILDYQRDQKHKSDQTYNKAYLMVGLFTSIWISSVVESLLQRPQESASNATDQPASPAPTENSHFSLQLRPNPHTFSWTSPVGLVAWTVRF